MTVMICSGGGKLQEEALMSVFKGTSVIFIAILLSERGKWSYQLRGKLRRNIGNKPFICFLFFKKIAFF